MKWTTIQKDGVIRTIDTKNDSLFDLFLDYTADRKERKEKKREEMQGKPIKDYIEKPINRGKIFIWILIFLLFIVIIIQLGTPA